MSRKPNKERAMHGRNRKGLTALDVVVTIVILLVLAALLIPAGTRHVPEAARRSQCKNNLKQIGLALMNYHDVHKTFPPGWIAGEPEHASSGFGWGFHLLPFIDQAPLFKKFNSKLGLADSITDNAKLTSSILTVYRCPSDQGSDQGKSPWIAELGVTNYVGNFGVGIPATFSVLEDSGGRLVDSRCLQGILGVNSRIRIRDVKDGMSNVILAGERRMSEHAGEWSVGRIEGNFNSYWAGIPNVNAVSPLAIVATSTGGLVERSFEEGATNNSSLTPVGNLKGLDTDTGRKTLPYFGINHDGRGMPLGDSDVVTAGFSSWHTGGAHVLMGDGPVRFISENIDPIVFTNLMRRSDGKTIGEF
jgi:type II secretory pathway pseudopilin PulG